jgi:chromosome segregation ATPase
MTERERATEHTVIYTDVEVFGPDDDAAVTPHQQHGMSIQTAELLDMLVSRFEDSILSRESQIDSLHRTLQDVQDSANMDREELENSRHIMRILERENTRLKAEAEELRRIAAEADGMRGQLAELEELRQQVAQLKKRRRLAQEIDELRKTVSELSFSSDRVLEQLLRQQSYE